MNMAEFEIAPGRMVGGNHPCFIIAEIGQNHQGDMLIAKKMIRKAKEAGADCAKFQKCELDQKFNKAALARPYLTKNSWGPTYGEHKKHIEFSYDEFRELKKYCEEIGIVFASSCGDRTSFDFVNKIGSPFFKIASPDSENIALVKYAASKKRPLVISTGMRTMQEVERIYDVMKNEHPDTPFTILQCTSTYPLPIDEVNLNVITTFRKAFPDIPIGYSGHESGTAISLGAIALGAKVLERHVTLDKTWKGSDHAASLDYGELAKLVSEIRELEVALGGSEKVRNKSEAQFYKKLGKTIVVTRNMTRGTVLKACDLDVKVAEPKGIAAKKIPDIIGKPIMRDIKADESVLYHDIECDIVNGA